VKSYQIFVNIWPGKYEEGQKLLKELSKLEINNLVAIVSGENEIIDAHKVVYLDHDAFFGNQFLAAIKMFNSDILIQIQSDAIIDDIQETIKSCVEAYTESNNLGIWAPDIDYTSWISEIARKKMFLSSRKKALQAESSQIEVLNTDCTFWSLSKEVIKEFQKIDFRGIKYGWGLDLIASAICRSKKLMVIRDLDFVVKHEKGTGYGEELARIEWKLLQKKIPFQIRLNLLINKIELIINKLIYLSIKNLKRLA
jgi:hypothetical protein